MPDAEFRSYYGRPVLKPPVWEHEIAAYLFTGGLAAGTAVLARGRGPHRAPSGCAASSWLGSLGGLLVSMWVLVSDLGTPDALPPHAARGQADLADERRHLDPHRLRPGGRRRRRATSWCRAPALAALVARAAADAGSPGPPGLSAAATAPGVASYTAVLLSHTAVPGVERGARRAAVRLHRLGRGQRRRLRHGLRTGGRERARRGCSRPSGAAQELVASRAMEQPHGPDPGGLPPRPGPRLGHGGRVC